MSATARVSVANPARLLEGARRRLMRSRNRTSPVGIVLLAFISLVVLPPTVFLVYTGFRTAAPGTAGASFTLHAWRGLFEHDSLVALKNTVVIGAVTTVLAVPIGFFFAWLQVLTNTPLIKYLSSLFLVPLVFSPLVLTISWTTLGSPRAGLANIFLAKYLGIHGLFNVYSTGGMIWISTLWVCAVR